jgi:hypothetical protein
MRINYYVKILALITPLFALFGGCQKDSALSPNISTAIGNGNTGQISVKDARLWFEGVQSRNGNEGLRACSGILFVQRT